MAPSDAAVLVEFERGNSELTMLDGMGLRDRNDTSKLDRFKRHECWQTVRTIAELAQYEVVASWHQTSLRRTN